MNCDTYITTTIPYVNASPHIGFALELVQADVVVRYHRLTGRPVIFQTGTDENALKNVLAAREKGVETRQFVEANSQAFRALLGALDVVPDAFIRTSEPLHATGVTAFWKSLRPGDIYSKSYNGLYCVGCEDFLVERDLVDGCCPDHRAPPTEIEEENYFFRLSRYQKEIEALICQDRVKIIPAVRRNEILAFVRGGLRDISISRDARRSGGWGIPVPGDESQVIYVWFDALLNYITGRGYGSGDTWQQEWGEGVRKIHVLGKNVWKFHAVYWPAFLLSAGLPLPDEIVVHGFVTVDGRKIGKSLGNAIDPLACVNEFGCDAVRYYLLKALPSFDDGDFSLSRLRDVYTSDLANGLGNLHSRLTALFRSAGFAVQIPGEPPEPPAGNVESLNRYEYGDALRSLWRIIENVNREIEQARPWEAIKSGDADSLRTVLARWHGELYRIAYWLKPFLPGTSEKIIGHLEGGASLRPAQLFPRR